MISTNLTAVSLRTVRSYININAETENENESANSTNKKIRRKSVVLSIKNRFYVTLCNS